MYSDKNSLINLAKSLIKWDTSYLTNGEVVDEKLFNLGLGVIEGNELYFRRILIGEREDISISTLAKAILESNSILLEPINANQRCYSIGKAIIDNSHLHLDNLLYDSSIYNFTKAIMTGDESYLTKITDEELIKYKINLRDEVPTDIKNVVWDDNEVLKCLVCKKGLSIDEKGYMNYYFTSNENRVVNQTIIYFKEVFRHRFYKFCSSECCNKWLGN